MTSTYVFVCVRTCMRAYSYAWLLKGKLDEWQRLAFKVSLLTHQNMLCAQLMQKFRSIARVCVCVCVCVYVDLWMTVLRDKNSLSTALLRDGSQKTPDSLWPHQTLQGRSLVTVSPDLCLNPRQYAHTHTHTHTHTRTCIALNSPVRPMLDALHEERDRPKETEKPRERAEGNKESKKQKEGREMEGETKRKWEQERGPGREAKESERDRAVLRAARRLFAAWEQACPTISLCPLQLYKAWETFYSSNHSDPLGFYSISGCLRIVFHHCYYI